MVVGPLINTEYRHITEVFISKQKEKYSYKNVFLPLYWDEHCVILALFGQKSLHPQTKNNSKNNIFWYQYF